MLAKLGSGQEENVNAEEVFAATLEDAIKHSFGEAEAPILNMVGKSII